MRVKSLLLVAAIWLSGCAAGIVAELGVRWWGLIPAFIGGIVCVMCYGRLEGVKR